MDKSTHEIRREQWTKIINECLSSGMKKTEWCKANGISDKAFFYWQRILRNETYIERQQLPAVADQKSEPPVAFVELRPTESAETKPVSFQPDAVIKKQGLVLEISNTASPELLKYLGGLIHAQ